MFQRRISQEELLKEEIDIFFENKRNVDVDSFVDRMRYVNCELERLHEDLDLFDCSGKNAREMLYIERNIKELEIIKKKLELFRINKLIT